MSSHAVDSCTSSLCVGNDRDDSDSDDDAPQKGGKDADVFLRECIVRPLGAVLLLLPMEELLLACATEASEENSNVDVSRVRAMCLDFAHRSPILCAFVDLLLSRVFDDDCLCVASVLKRLDEALSVSGLRQGGFARAPAQAYRRVASDHLTLDIQIPMCAAAFWSGDEDPLTDSSFNHQVCVNNSWLQCFACVGIMFLSVVVLN